MTDQNIHNQILSELEKFKGMYYGYHMYRNNLYSRHLQLWNMIGSTDIPYENHHASIQYQTELKSFQLGISVDGDIARIEKLYLSKTINLSQLLILFNNKKEFDKFNNKYRQHIVLELCKTIKNDVNILNKVQGIKLLISHLNVLNSDERKIITRSFRFKNENIYKNQEQLMTNILNKYLPDIAKIATLALLIKTKEISEMTISEWQELIHASKTPIQQTSMNDITFDF